MDALSPVHLAAALAVVAVAYVVRGIAGFGSGLIATPLLLMFLPLTTAVPLVVVLDYAASAAQGISDRQQIAWREIGAVLPTAVIGVATAFWLFHVVDTQWLVKILAIFLIAFALYQLRATNTERRASQFWALPAGIFGGLIGTLFGTGGPFYVAYLHARQLDKVAFRATFSTIFLLDGMSRIAGYALSGFFDSRFLSILMWLAPVMAVGIFVGRRLHTTISQQTFRRGISVLLLFSGAVLLLK
jgi:uncharacterized membrane protein YfcA